MCLQALTAVGIWMEEEQFSYQHIGDEGSSTGFGHFHHAVMMSDSATVVSCIKKQGDTLL